MQDIPYLIVRLILIKHAGLLYDQKLFFFTIKNVFMIIVDGYQFCNCFKEYKENVHALKNHQEVHTIKMLKNKIITTLDVSDLFHPNKSVKYFSQYCTGKKTAESKTFLNISKSQSTLLEHLDVRPW